MYGKNISSGKVLDRRYVVNSHVKGLFKNLIVPHPYKIIRDEVLEATVHRKRGWGGRSDGKRL
jgi:hypothetical protein